MEFMSTYRRQLQLLGSVALAMLLDAIVGLDREIAHKPAGLRTHMMVSGAAALLVALGDVIIYHFDRGGGAHHRRPAPVRRRSGSDRGPVTMGVGGRHHCLGAGHVATLTPDLAVVGAALAVLSAWSQVMGE